MLLIYSPEFSERCKYVFDLIFKDESGIEYSVTKDLDVFKDYPNEKINYSGKRIAEEFFIKSNPFLFENEIKKQQIFVEQKQQIKVLFPTEEDDLGFDIFSAVFYLLSRYEEYLPFTPDESGRFKAEDSLTFQNGFLHLPIVNLWIDIFKKLLQKKFPLLQTKSTVFNAIVTYDIDVAYKFKGRSVERMMGSVMKDVISFKIKNIGQRIETLSKFEKDPWDTYDDLEQSILQNKLQSVFFFLLADNTRYDHNLDYQNPIIKQLIQKIKSFSEIGIHPSFYSSIFPEKILIEKERLENLSGKKIFKNRQHYLKFVLPDTYRNLLSAGITEDYSMGFAKMAGFRAGTCKPFYFYDLRKEKTTGLKIFPITFMEGTLMNLKPEEALQKILQLLKEVKKVGGTFIPLWHNHTISETNEYFRWKNVHDKMIKEISFTLNAS